MKPKKYTFEDTKKINLNTKIIYKYPTPTQLFDIARMVVKGRHPEDKNTFIIEEDCSFIIYVIKGKGTVYAGEKELKVSINDVVLVPKGNKFAIKGNLEYITVNVPAFYLEQSTEVKN